jgi:ABC-2 type transport system ATP-binding protein
MLVTHRMEEVEQLCDRILFLRNGIAAEYGTVDDIKDKSGKQLISVNFTGKLPANNKIYKIVKSLPHYAELSWLPGKSADDILRFLASDDDLHITTFDVRRPSLNDIFLDLYKVRS